MALFFGEAVPLHRQLKGLLLPGLPRGQIHHLGAAVEVLPLAVAPFQLLACRRYQHLLTEPVGRRCGWGGSAGGIEWLSREETEMEDSEDEDTFVPDFEEVAGRSIAVLYYKCPKCGTRTRFTAEDEGADGTMLACPDLSCRLALRLEPRGLRAVQRELDENERALAETLEKLGSSE